MQPNINHKELLHELYLEYEKKEAHLRLINMGFTEKELYDDFELTKEQVEEAFALQARRNSHRVFMR